MTTIAQSSKHRAALEFARAGYFLFPIEPNGKIPLVKDWEHVATTDPKQIDEFWSKWPDANIGTAPARRDCMVIDLDIKNGKNGVQELDTIAEANGILPDTLTVRTPTGGFHQWFSVRPLRGLPTSSAGRIAPGVDVRAQGGYVLLPPSVVGGSAYTVVADEPIAEVPDWLLSAAKNSSRGQAVSAPANVEIDEAQNVSRAVEFLKHAAPAIEGQGGDDHTFKIAAEVRDLGVSEQTALDLMERHWNARCVPPWEPDELAVKVANAYRYAKNDPGAFAIPPTEIAFADYLKTLPAPSGPTRFSDVLTRAVAPVQEIVPELVEKGTVTFLSAPGGSHKSRVALQWGLSIDAGVNIFGRSVQRSRFVYLSYEDHRDEVTRRAQAIARRLKLPLDSSGEFWDMSGKDAPLAIVSETGECAVTEFGKSFVGHLKAIPDHKFVVIDSTYNALRFVGSAKINEGAVMAGIGYLQHICDEANATLLVLWHPSQAGQERGDASGWSVAWHNAPRARLSLTAVPNTPDAFDLKVEKRNHGSKGKPITLHWSEGALLPRAETETSEQEASLLRAVVRVAIAAAEQGVPIQRKGNLLKWQLDEIESAIGRRPAQREVKEVLASALPRGLLRYVSHTRHRMSGYYPADEETAVTLATAAKRRTATQVEHA